MNPVGRQPASGSGSPAEEREGAPRFEGVLSQPALEMPTAKGLSMADELATGERWAAEHKLLRRADFQACYKNGRRQGGRFSTLFYRPNDLGHPRLGITATRKLGKAVLRQKAKRRVREIYRRWPDRHRMAALDLVVHFKPSITEAPFDDLRRDLLRQLALASGLIESRGRAPRSGRTRRPEERS